MKKIGDITNTADKNGEFTDGNVAAGTPPTQLMGAWFNSVQREILNVLAKAGIPQSATKEDQLAEAITKIVAGAGYLPTGYSYSKIESDDRYQPKGNYAPAGDYATNAALNNGLNSKVNKDNAEINSSLKIKYPGDYAKFFLEKLSGENFSIETVPDALALAATFFYKDKTGKTIASITVPKKSGSMALVSDIPEIPTSSTKFEDVTSSRSNNVNYVNTKNHLIFVVLYSSTSVGQNATYTVSGVVVRWAVSGYREGFLTSATIPVPPGATYSANGFVQWFEVS